jgi:hypothetical protein
MTSSPLLASCPCPGQIEFSQAGIAGSTTVLSHCKRLAFLTIERIRVSGRHV